MTDWQVGGSTDSQREFLEALSTEDTRRNQDRQSSKQPPIANNFALGYTYHDVLDADHEGTIFRWFSYFGSLLTMDRYSGPPLSLPPYRPITLFHSPITTPSYPTNNPEYPHRHPTRLVTTMVLASAVTRLDPAFENPSSIAGCRLQREDGRGYAQLERQRTRWEQSGWRRG
jgi:hypothetical protein